MEKILITPRGFSKFGHSEKQILEDHGFEVDWNDTGKPLPAAVFAEKAKEATGIIVGVDLLDEKLLRSCSKLKAIVKFGVGVDNIDLKVCEELGIKVSRCIGTNSNAVAEYTIGMIFICARNLYNSINKVKNGQWQKPTGIELQSKKLGIIGFGNIGRKVAKKAIGLGMEVQVFDTYDIDPLILKEYDVKKLDFDEIISQSDIISIHVPLTNETLNMISEKQFRKMKKNVILINAARGGIVDERALYTALKNHQIYACASDVFSEEPPKNERWINELIQMDNFILTAHIGSRSEESEKRTIQKSTEELLKNLV